MPRRDDYDDDDRPRRRRRPRDEDEYDDDDDDYSSDNPMSYVVPYKNGMALAAYYCGVFSLIPCLGGILGPVAFILGILGLRYVRQNPAAHGTGHALTGIILGGITGFLHIAGLVVFIVLAAMGKLK